MTSYGLSEVVLHSVGAHVTLHNKHRDGLHVVLDEWYKNAQNFIKENKYVLNNSLRALIVIIYHPKHTIALHFLFFFCVQKGGKVFISFAFFVDIVHIDIIEGPLLSRETTDLGIGYKLQIVGFVETN